MGAFRSWNAAGCQDSGTADSYVLILSRSPPEPFKPGRVLDGVLNVPVSKIVLNEPRIRALVGQGEAASVAQHMRVGKQGQGSGGAVFLQGQVHGGSVP